jgi:hypothetical protein
VVGATALLFSTRWGVGLSPDWVVYIASGRNLLSGYGLSDSFTTGEFLPLTHYSLLISAGLAGLGLVGIDPLDGARWFNALIFRAKIPLPGLVVYF